MRKYFTGRQNIYRIFELLVFVLISNMKLVFVKETHERKSKKAFLIVRERFSVNENVCDISY